MSKLTIEYIDERLREDKDLLNSLKNCYSRKNDIMIAYTDMFGIIKTRKEVWIEAQDFEDKYDMSNYARIYNKKTKKLLKPQFNTFHIDLYYVLSDKDKRVNRYISSIRKYYFDYDYIDIDYEHNQLIREKIYNAKHKWHDNFKEKLDAIDKDLIKVYDDFVDSDQYRKNEWMYYNKSWCRNVSANKVRWCFTKLIELGIMEETFKERYYLYKIVEGYEDSDEVKELNNKLQYIII